MQGVESRTRAGLAGLVRWGQLHRLREMLRHVLARNPFWQRKLDGLPLPSDAETFLQVPLSSNEDLSADLLEHPPYGSNLTYPLEAYTKYHQTSGTMGQPLVVLDTPPQLGLVV